ncbi:DUF1232 domain-containing protein [Bacillus sp. FJAT-49736]|uniref:DUF1232 domain-containing protein n=1 Tax=Bacillus sp. FJAT-49736 TaxID=2833582 RepID=UPI001BCA6689|nr:DUF1232 domain-containing protein [Bacillus sp. FJAT-49736]MBS4173980.1 DUF1232 domain-containing protein [Bacillus sp. FJAT-49736]
MTIEGKNDQVGILLKELLKERSLSMRKFSELTGIDTATISRIVNGKRKATPVHLRKFAECLDMPLTKFLEAAGYPIEDWNDRQLSDIHVSVNNIQSLLESSDVYDKNFSIENIEKQLVKYEQYSQTEEGKETILEGFEEKLQKVGSIGPFINQLKAMYEKFRLSNGTPKELILIGSALIYFILPVDVIPDYIFPIGYLDDATAVQIVMGLLLMKD